MAMWMKNTYIPLDMSVHQGRRNGGDSWCQETVPYSLETIESGEPVAAVLEVAAGAGRSSGSGPAPASGTDFSATPSELAPPANSV